jgi:hypothetical protein
MGLGDYDDDNQKLRYLGVLARDPLLLNMLMLSVHETSRYFAELVAAGDGTLPVRNGSWRRDAIMEALDHPDKTDKEIAAKLGIHRTKLYESGTFKELRKVQISGHIPVKDPERKPPVSRSGRLAREKFRDKLPHEKDK